MSEDLDFFSSDNVDLKRVLNISKSFESFEIINQTKEQINLLVDNVKLTFFNSRWKFLNNNLVNIEELKIASLDSLAAMKINTLFIRAKYRDYYNLYILSKEKFTIRELFEKAKDIVPGLTFKLFSIALVFVDDIDDENLTHLNLKVKISKEEISNYFTNLLRNY